MPAASSAEPLPELLGRIFGFPSFRANQEEVCRTVIGGQDVLLVMPTGSGKSLCYQLPGLARGGTTLVVSPLIALMDDQVAKLAALRIPVARIHSGLDRPILRQACIDYLKGGLRFLFIAPERLQVPGFAEMLAKRKPTLIAIDEAHCISQWGHDFRPDYRTLGQYLPSLRPSPVIALTATATPRVQGDIVAQLGLQAPARFIHGFRRDNLAIEVVEVSRPERAALVCQLLSDPQRRPAIVYAPTRKEAETLAALLSKQFPAAGYHAGLPSDRRQQVQRWFLEGRVAAVVATIAFGMGIDKPDVRTVIHTALPGSLEAFYQEIGRAGRDGLPSRTLLMHSYADRRTHDYFFERDYPTVGTLDHIFRQLRPEPQGRESLKAKVPLEPEVFDKALEKLSVHGGAVLDAAGNVLRGREQWRTSYLVQLEQRRAQLDRMMYFAENPQCRMSALVRHFGDLADARRDCGQCDSCAPQRRLVRGLQLVPEAGYADRTGSASARFSPGRSRSRTPRPERSGGRSSSVPHGEEWPAARKNGNNRPPAVTHAPLSASAEALEKTLQLWRRTEAEKLAVPAFCILGNRTLRAIAAVCPTDARALLAVPGIGPAKLDKFGAALCRICTEAGRAGN
jgi:RecQ family ATP-dependent DNA helicase